MSYPSLPDKRIGYDNDGTVIYYNTDARTDFASGPVTQLTGSNLIALNGYANAQTSTQVAPLGTNGSYNGTKLWLFFPERREVGGIASVAALSAAGTPTMQGSNDTTNGMDGTWETASFPSGTPPSTPPPVPPDQWRSAIMPISFTGTKQTVRYLVGAGAAVYVLHLYGIKDAAATPDDLIFMSAASGGTQVLNEDVGDVPFGTTRTMQVWLKNTSATKTASTINLQLNDANWIFSTDNATWVTSINIASLAAGATYGPIYVRQTSPAQGSPLGPRFARVVVSGYTFA